MDVDIQLTDAARARMHALLQDGAHRGMRLCVRQAGCSGYEYVLDYTDMPAADDLRVPLEHGVLYIDRESYETALKGLRIDFQQDVLSSSFVYDNPNKTGECGCGVSFSID